MKRLIDYTRILRSKNAGPLFITFDLIFPDKAIMKNVFSRLTKDIISKAYDIDSDKIEIIEYDVVNAIKITFPRKFISGNMADNDIYGCQQHMPLANIMI